MQDFLDTHQQFKGRAISGVESPLGVGSLEGGVTSRGGDRGGPYQGVESPLGVICKGPRVRGGGEWNHNSRYTWGNCKGGVYHSCT